MGETTSLDPTVVVNLALVALQGVLSVIGAIKGQAGLTDDQILAQAQAVTTGNDQAYQTLVAALQGSVVAPAVPAVK